MSGRRFGSLSVVILLVIAALGLGASAALAFVLSPTSHPLPHSNFQGGDGNQLDAPPHIDWQGLRSEGVVEQTSDRTGHDEDHFHASKELEPGAWSLRIGNMGAPGANILDTYRVFKRAANGDAFLYLAMTREQASGTWYFTFELNQEAPRRYQTVDGSRLAIPCRRTGDLLIAFTTHGNQTTAHVEEWITRPENDLDSFGCARAGTLEDVTPRDGLNHQMIQGAFNQGTIRSELPGHYAPGAQITVHRFVETAINLTKVLRIEEGHDFCEGGSFVSIWAHSRASGRNSDMKDYVAPKPFVIGVCKESPSLSTAQGATINGVEKTPVTSVPIGTSIFDTANLTGGRAPTGTITFKLYGPSQPTCSGRPIFTSTVPVEGATGPHKSGSFTPTALGTYRWTATYSGDDNNHGFGPTACTAEPVTVTKAQPEIATEASGTTVLPGQIHDTATLTGGHNPTGTITFEVFAPNNPTCTPPAAHSETVPVNANGQATTSGFTPTGPGTWRWIATYNGDGNNNVAGPTACGAPGEETAVDRPQQPPPGTPGLTTTATPSAPAGSAIQDTAHLSGGSNPTGYITFYVFGPDDSSCSGPPATAPSQVQVFGPGAYTSAPFIPADPGTYRWIAHYSGDSNNEPAATTCNESGESSVVSISHPSITTSASPATASYGSSVGDTAVLSGGANPTGTIEFRLYGPDDATCAGPPAFIVHQAVHGNGEHPSPTPTPTLSGTYRWIAVYSGDAHNAGVSTTCNESGETVVVGQPPTIHPTPEEPEPKPHHPKPKPKPHRPKPKPIFTG